MSGSAIDELLKKSGVNRSNGLLAALILVVGGFEHHAKGEDAEACRTQLAETKQAVALLQQAQINELAVVAELKTQVVQLDRDLRALTRSVDRQASGKPVASVP